MKEAAVKEDYTENLPVRCETCLNAVGQILRLGNQHICKTCLKKLEK